MWKKKGSTIKSINTMNGDFIAPPNFSESFRKVSEGGAQYVFARDITDTGHKKYTKDLTPEQMITYQNQQHIFERSFYEVMLPQKPIKLFYDIDMCPAIENGDLLDQLINEILEITAISMKEMYNISNITNTDFAVLDSSGNVNKPTGIVSKTSLHIVLVNKVCFKTIKNMKEYVSYVFSEKSGYLKSGVDLHIDQGVYRHGCLRMPGSTKRGQNRHLRILTDQFTQLDCMVTNVNTTGVDILEKPVKKDTKRKEDHLMRIAQARIGVQQISNDDIYRQVIDALPSFLATNYDDWINTGIKMYTAGVPETLWHEFSKKSVEQYNYITAHEKWMSFSTYTIGSMAGLFRLLRTHGQDQIADNLLRHTLRFMGKYNNDIALGLARLYGDDHVFSENVWYFYNGSRWIEDKAQTHISRTIMTRFQKRLDHEIHECAVYFEHHQPDHPSYTEEMVRSKNLYTIKEKTQSGRIGSDWHVLAVTFEQEKFASLLDTQLHLIGFDNGVYDLTSNTFRNMTRDDKITMTTGYNYEHVYDAQDYHGELDMLLQQIFPDTDILEYMLCFLGSCLCGKVNEELIHFWTGLSNKQTGSNGKSTFVSLLLLTFGDYAMCGHSSIITSKRENSSSANSALMALKGVRLVTFQEIDDVNNINMPVIKSLTGNDTVSGRQLYKTQETFLPQWHLVVCANKLPPVSSDDGGTQRRLRNVPFESKFVDNPKDAKWRHISNVYAVDYQLKNKLQYYKLPLMHRLIEGYQKYVTMNELPPCPKILAHTALYFKNQNMLYQFLWNTITPCPNKNTRIPLRDLILRMGATVPGRHDEIELIDTIQEYFPDAVIEKNEYNHHVLIGYAYIDCLP